MKNRHSGGLMKLMWRTFVSHFASTEVKTSNLFFTCITVQIKCGWCYMKEKVELKAAVRNDIRQNMVMYVHFIYIYIYYTVMEVKLTKQP